MGHGHRTGLLPWWPPSFQAGKIPPASGRPLSSCWGSCRPGNWAPALQGDEWGPGFCLSKGRAMRRRAGDGRIPSPPSIRNTAHLPQSSEQQSPKDTFGGQPLTPKSPTTFLPPYPAAAIHDCPTPATGLASTCSRMLLPAFLGNSPFTTHLSILPGLADPREREGI